jgi:hypothetical protein
MNLDQLADAINNEHATAEAAVRDSVLHARQAGQLLQDVKARLPHGQFMLWVEQHCHFKYPTAALYMRIARQWSVLFGLLALDSSYAVRTLTLGKAATLVYGCEQEVEDPERTARTRLRRQRREQRNSIVDVAVRRFENFLTPGRREWDVFSHYLDREDQERLLYALQQLRNRVVTKIAEVEEVIHTETAEADAAVTV